MKNLTLKISYNLYPLIIVFLFLLSESVFSQNDSILHLQNFHMERKDINETAMLVLGSWAVGNILIGTYSNFKASGEAKYFHQFNAMWNVVNLGIAAFGYFNAANSDPSSITNLEIIKDYNSLQNFLLLNAGLDVSLFFIHQNNANINLYPHLESFLAGGVGIGINFKI